MDFRFALGIVTPWGGDALARLRFNSAAGRAAGADRSALKYSPTRREPGNARKGARGVHLEICISIRFSSFPHWTWYVSPSTWSSIIKLYMFCVGNRA